MLALEGIRILDMARLGPGPHCAQILGDLGADIIRIEEPGPGQGQRAGRMLRLPDDAPIKRNSRSIALNLKCPEGIAVFLRLSATADVIVEGFRPGVAKRLGVDYEAVRNVKPAVVYASLSGYGQDGPYAPHVGHDINFQGMAGILDMTGERGGPPVIPGITIADNAGGMNAALSIMAALVARGRTGRGQCIDLSMLDALVTMMFYPISAHIAGGEIARRGETFLTGLYPWYNVYQAADGKYLTVGAVEPWFYENLCRALGCEDFVADQYAEGERREHVFATFRRIFLTKTRDEWVAELMPAGTCVAPVYSIDEVVRDPQLRHRQMILGPEGADGRQEVGVMVKLSETPGAIRHPAPSLGQHTKEILEEIGYAEDGIESLARAGAIPASPGAGGGATQRGGRT
jgi:crotonobetainyl-CoA:carnitine CoA-transferase CaiB-like acyl-CoA transferase